MVLLLFKEHCRLNRLNRSLFIPSCILSIFICFWLQFIQDGVRETGVSLAFTVRALDAGPVIASQKIGVDDDIKVLILCMKPNYFILELYLELSKYDLLSFLYPLLSKII